MHARRRSRRPLILAAVVTAALTLGACASSGAPGDSDAGATGGELRRFQTGHVQQYAALFFAAAALLAGVIVVVVGG